MTCEELEQKLIDIQTIQVMLDDKLHRIMANHNRQSMKISELEKELKQHDVNIKDL